jgi:hypothetical protein
LIGIRQVVQANMLSPILNSANETNQKKNTHRMSNGLLAVINSLIAAGTTPSSSYCYFEFFPSNKKNPAQAVVGTTVHQPS